MLSFLLRVDKRFHALIVRTFGLYEVDEVEFVGHALSYVRYSEVKPLRVGSSVVIVLEDEVVLRFADFDSSAEVARFKAAFKDEGVVIWTLLLVVSLKLGVVPVDLLAIFLVESVVGAVRVEFTRIILVFFGGQLNEVSVVQIGCVIALHPLRGVVHAVINRFLRAVTQRLFPLQALVLIAESGVELENGLEVLAHVPESRSVPHERLLNASPRKLHRRQNFIILLILHILGLRFLGWWLSRLLRGTLLLSTLGRFKTASLGLSHALVWAPASWIVHYPISAGSNYCTLTLKLVLASVDDLTSHLLEVVLVAAGELDLVRGRDGPVTAVALVILDHLILLESC